MSNDLIQLVRAELQQQVNALQEDVHDLHINTEQAGYSNGVQAYTAASLPVNGVANGQTYVTIAFCSNGRKAGEGAGAGTGVMVYWNAASLQWFKVSDDTVVTI